MQTNIDIDDDLMAQAMRLSGLRGQKEVIEESLRCLIKLRKQSDIRQLFGKFPLDIDLDRSRRD
jgi:Arc/MetJ family transcription regulator